MRKRNHKDLIKQRLLATAIIVVTIAAVIATGDGDLGILLLPAGIYMLVTKEIVVEW